MFHEIDSPSIDKPESLSNHEVKPHSRKRVPRPRPRTAIIVAAVLRAIERREKAERLERLFGKST